MKLRDIVLLPYAVVIFYWATLVVWNMESTLSLIQPANLPTRIGPSRRAQLVLFASTPLFVVCVGIVWILEHLP